MKEDTVKMFLRKSNSPFEIVDSSKTVVNENGEGTFVFSRAVNGEEYYLEIVHRNTVSTWSSTPVAFSFGNLTYDFTLDAALAFGGNEKLVDSDPVTFAIYNGDVDRNDQVDLNDMISVYNSSAAFQTEYLQMDVTGDNVVNLQDLLITANNAALFIESITP